MSNRHSTFICSPHVEGCSCHPRSKMVCNPYCVLGYCPTDGEGDECKADPSRLVRIPVKGGFTLGLN